MGGRGLERCWQSRRGRLGSVFERASTDSGGELRKRILQANFCGISAVFRGAGEGPRSRSSKLLKIHHHSGATNRELSQKDVAQSATLQCSGISHFLEESNQCFLNFHEKTVEVAHLSRRGAYAKAWRPMRESSSRGALYNVADLEYVSASETLLYNSFSQTQLKVLLRSTLDARQMKTVVIQNNFGFFLLLSSLCY